MPRKKMKKGQNRNFFPLFLLFFMLVGGIFVFLQSQKSQEINSRAATTNCTVSSSQLPAKSQEQTLFDKINQYRAQKGLGKLTWDTTLKQAATWLSLDMAAHNTLSHTDSLGRSSPIRLKNCGYDSDNNFGEDLVWTSSTNPDDALNYWKSSAAHDDVLLVQTFNIGAVSMVTSGGKTYWTLDAGIKSSSPTFACLGTNNCVPTAVPTRTPTKVPTKTPSSPTPTSSTTAPLPTSESSPSPTEAVTGTPSNNGSNKNRGKQNGFISFLISFLILLIQFLLGLFKS